MDIGNKVGIYSSKDIIRGSLICLKIGIKVAPYLETLGVDFFDAIFRGGLSMLVYSISNNIVIEHGLVIIKDGVINFGDLEVVVGGRARVTESRIPVEDVMSFIEDDTLFVKVPVTLTNHTNNMLDVDLDALFPSYFVYEDSEEPRDVNGIALCAGEYRELSLCFKVLYSTVTDVDLTVTYAGDSSIVPMSFEMN